MSANDEPKDRDEIAAEIDAHLDATMGQGGGDLEKAVHREEGQPPPIVRGHVVGFSANHQDAIVELEGGPREQGTISVEEFDDPPRFGDPFDFVVVGRADDGLWILSRSEVKQLASWKEMEKGKLVTARVTGQNTGGLELKVGPTDAFMPASQVSLHKETDLAHYIGQNLVCQVMEVDRRRKRVTLSRRKVLEQEAREKRAEVVAELVPGAVVKGTVTRIEDFGAFVEIRPGVEGLLHVSNISRQRVKHPSDRLKEGDQVELAVLEISQGGKRIGLGMKQLEPDPWDEVVEAFPPGTLVTGKVARLATFGAFVNLMDGVDGLVHVSQMGLPRGRHVSDAVKEGAELTVRVVSVDRDKQRIALSRLDDKGKIIGAEDESAADEDIEEVRRESQRPDRGGVNLGDLLRKALED